MVGVCGWNESEEDGIESAVNTPDTYVPEVRNDHAAF